MSATLKIRVIPRARRNDITGWRDEALVVRLTAPPLDGAANKLLRRFLAKRLGVRPGDVEIIKGERSRNKVLRIAGIEQNDVQQLLE
ncbi:MAG TPA: DUF167 domain-containing protein [Armatimonadota bacterium]|nr:DUF167 domain-containing protein [Armatimonadota bacterium]